MIGRTLAHCRVTVAVAASALFTSLGAAPAGALEPSPVATRIDAALAANRQELIEWRRHLHRNPELGNREVETAKFVAERLRSFGLEPRTGVARTGVVAVIEGGRPGPVVALRADMDALPVTEEVDLPFASKATATWEGKTVGVGHACGYDTHVNHPALTERMLPTLERLAPGRVRELPKVTGAEDFSFFANRVPGLFVMVGVTPADQMATAASNHSPRFYVDETALPTGARALAQLTADYLFANAR